MNLIFEQLISRSLEATSNVEYWNNGCKKIIETENCLQKRNALVQTLWVNLTMANFPEDVKI